MRPVIIISGPTASGKTSISIEAAKNFNGEVVNCDSLLFYKDMNIGTAKPTLIEMDNIPHHFISTNEVDSPLNAHEYMSEAVLKVNDILSRNKTVFIVGGSGFYIQALIQGMYQSEPNNPHIRKRSDKLYEENGIEAFRSQLEIHDPESLDRYHQNDHYRIRRALEYFWLTGKKLSAERINKDKQNDLQDKWNSVIHNWDVLNIYLNPPKSEHLEIISQRTEQMINGGLIQEVQSLIEKYPTLPKPLKSIGYKEVIAYLNKEYTIEDCIERIKISTRQLAKSQRTWFNKKDKLEFNPLTDKDKILSTIKEFIYE